MSKHTTGKRITVPALRARKGGEPIVCLTAYTTPVARLLDRHCDLLLVGDSLGMVVHGLPDTVGVTMEMMILHGQAVMRGSSAPRRGRPAVRLLRSPGRAAYANAARVMKETGARRSSWRAEPTWPRRSRFSPSAASR